MSEYAFEAAKRSTASISWSFATQTLVGDLSTPFSHSIEGAYQTVIVQAFARWASVSGLTFTQVADAATVPIRVGFGVFALVGELGETDYRYSRGVLANDTLIRLLDPAVVPVADDGLGGYYYTRYNVTMFQVVLHEIGHALGLAHSTDPDTLMYPYASANNEDLAAGDIQGINTLYPYFTVASSDAMQLEGAAGQTTTYHFTVTRYGDPGVALTIGYAVSGVAYPSLSGSIPTAASVFGGAYPTGQLSFAAGSTTAMLSITVVGNAVAQPDQGFAIALSSLNAGDSVTVRGTVNALVLDDDGFGQVSGRTVGVYRFFDTADGTHFYSINQAERNALILSRPDLTYEGVGLNAVAEPSAEPATAAVFRFFDTHNGTHFYTIDPGERDTILAQNRSLTFEGTAFYEHLTAQAGDTPVYRFFDVGDGAHFYTASAIERATVLASRADLRDEGVAFYAPGV